jgi:hypothetical protein
MQNRSALESNGGRKVMRKDGTSSSGRKQIAMNGNWKSLKTSAFSAGARSTKEPRSTNDNGAADDSGAA